MKTLGVDSNLSFQPSFCSKTDRHFPRVFGGFLERRIPGLKMEMEVALKKPRSRIGLLAQSTRSSRRERLA